MAERDPLALTVEKAIAALAELVGEYDVSGDRIGEAGPGSNTDQIPLPLFGLKPNSFGGEVKAAMVSSSSALCWPRSTDATTSDPAIGADRCKSSKQAKR